MLSSMQDAVNAKLLANQLAKLLALSLTSLAKIIRTKEDFYYDTQISIKRI